MITAKDLAGTSIPKSGMCPICFDVDHKKVKVYLCLRLHLVKAHGFPILTHEERLAKAKATSRTAYNQDYREKNRDVFRARSHAYRVKQRRRGE